MDRKKGVAESKCNHVWRLAFTKMKYVRVCWLCNEMEEIEDQSACKFEDIEVIIFNADEIKEENLWKI